MLTKVEHYESELHMKISGATLKQLTISAGIYFAFIFVWRFCSARWPNATDVATWVGGALCAICYLWHFFIIPFRQGLRGNDEGMSTQ
jgi:hypothetical protein